MPNLSNTTVKVKYLNISLNSLILPPFHPCQSDSYLSFYSLPICSHLWAALLHLPYYPNTHTHTNTHKHTHTNTHMPHTHTHSQSCTLTSFTPTPPAAAPAGSTQRQAKCMLMRARPMVEPHSFWEEMAFNNGGPRGDFAQSSAPLWKMHSIHCCVCSLFLSYFFFPLNEKKEKRKRKKHSRDIFASPPPLASVFMLRGVRGSLGDWGVMIYLYRSIRKKRTQPCAFE